ncbi:MAG: class I SAM-dependent methyltransferase [Oscillospiraceae bacterium]
MLLQVPHFSVQDMFHLPYADHSFDVAIVSNALHIVPQPEKALAEACRVLKDDGLLDRPHFHPWGQYTAGGRFNPFSCGCPVFRFAARWTCEEYLAFLRQCGWRVRTSWVLPASFPLTYAECIKSEV